MLRFFRINDPYRLLAILIILTLISLPFFIDPAGLSLPELKARVLGGAIADGKQMYTQIYDDTPPLAAAFFGLMDLIFGRSVFAWQLIALFIIFFQASYFGIILVNSKAYEENTYLPSLIYGVLAFISFDLFSFSAELLASTFLLFTVNNLFKEIEFRIQRDETVLNIGVTLGLSSILVFSYIVFLPAVIFLFSLFGRITLRKVLMLLFGFVLPHAILIILYFYWGKTPLLWENFYLPNLEFSKHTLISFRSLLVLATVPLTYFLFSLIMLNRVARFTRYQSQLLQVMFIWFVPGIMLIMLSRELTPHSFYVFIPTLTYFISHYLLLIRRKWIAETMLWFFLGGVICVSILARYHKIFYVDYSTLLVKTEVKPLLQNKKIMVLGDNLSVYRFNSLGGYFLNWDISKKVFENTGYYENIITIEDSFKTDAPDVIIDEKNLMVNIMERLPSLKIKYKKIGNQYVKI